MSWELIVILGAMTYASRAAALASLPPLPPAAAAVLDRVPPALFAGLAVQALLTPAQGLAEGPVLAAAAGAVALSPLRSLPICLLAGIGAYLAAGLLSRP